MQTITHKVKFHARPIGAIGKLTTNVRTLNLKEPDHDGEKEIRKKLGETFQDILIVEVAPNKSQTNKYYREQDLQKQVKALEKLISLCGGSKLQPLRIYWKLRRIEKLAQRAAENLCNVPNYNIEPEREKAISEVQKLFNGNLKGLFFNQDPRGYAIKIEDTLLKTGGIYNGIGLHTDLGQDGILAPEFN